MIKLIILDVDGTFYNINDVADLNFDLETQFLCDQCCISKKDAIKQLNQNGIFDSIRRESKSATEYFSQIGLPAEQWKQYRELNFNVSLINKENAITNCMICDLHNIAPLVIVSSNSEQNIRNILNFLEIDLNYFRGLYTSDNYVQGGRFSKKRVFREILDKEGLKGKNVVSIGDRYFSDIQPIEDLGGKGFLVSNKKDFTKVIKLLRDL
ncbi:MAG: HAD hydrolase-like protein [Clostridiales bacterium]|nr:HAD hydrolase-like protein [Clostridiales bacterium]